MMALNTIYRGDALALLANVDDNSIDLIICDGPYGVTQNVWDKPKSGIQAFNLKLLAIFAKKIKPGGSLYLFGKPNCIDFIDYRPYFKLHRRIIWYQPSRLAQGRINYTNNYDVICYFVRGDKAKTFNLDAIRVPQLVELTQRRRCEQVPSVTNGRFANTRFNDNGKNPGDVWGDIKQLTYRSKELVSREALNTIQKPAALIERLVLASSHPGDIVLDPFAGVGTGPVVCAKHQRHYIAFEQNIDFVTVARSRVAAISNSTAAAEPEPLATQ